MDIPPHAQCSVGALSRLKISASTKFINELADVCGEAILVLGSRKAESIARDRVLSKYENSTRAEQMGDLFGGSKKESATVVNNNYYISTLDAKSFADAFGKDVITIIGGAMTGNTGLRQTMRGTI